jgi:homoserine O-succinyltransferase/O-acetyltransferase
MKIAILDMYNDVPNEGMRCIVNILREFREKNNIEDFSYQIFNVRAKNEIPNVADFEVFISTGGPGDPTAAEPFEPAFFELIDQLFEHNKNDETKKFLFGICHSFQLIAKHLQVGQVCKRNSTSFGVFPLPRTQEGFQEPFFSGLPEPFYVVDSRDYQLIQPNISLLNQIGAEILCLEKFRPHVELEQCVMAIRYTNEIFTTQFHPEADAEGMLRYFEREDKRKAVIENHGEEKYYDMVTKLNDADKIMLTESIIIPKFLERAYHSLEKILV